MDKKDLFSAFKNVDKKYVSEADPGNAAVNVSGRTGSSGGRFAGVFPVLAAVLLLAGGIAAGLLIRAGTGNKTRAPAPQTADPNRPLPESLSAYMDSYGFVMPFSVNTLEKSLSNYFYKGKPLSEYKQSDDSAGDSYPYWSEIFSGKAGEAPSYDFSFEGYEVYDGFFSKSFSISTKTDLKGLELPLGIDFGDSAATVLRKMGVTYELSEFPEGESSLKVAGDASSSVIVSDYSNQLVDADYVYTVSFTEDYAGNETIELSDETHQLKTSRSITFYFESGKRFSDAALCSFRMQVFTETSKIVPDGIIESTEPPAVTPVPTIVPTPDTGEDRDVAADGEWPAEMPDDPEELRAIKKELIPKAFEALKKQYPRLAEVPEENLVNDFYRIDSTTWSVSFCVMTGGIRSGWLFRLEQGKNRGARLIMREGVVPWDIAVNGLPEEQMETYFAELDAQIRKQIDPEKLIMPSQPVGNHCVIWKEQDGRLCLSCELIVDTIDPESMEFGCQGHAHLFGLVYVP